VMWPGKVIRWQTVPSYFEVPDGVIKQINEVQ